jgi:Xaa-Pro dipeptidase
MNEGLSLQERDRRWARVRQLMAEENLDILVSFPEWVPGNSIYLANEDGAVIFSRDDEPVLVAARGEPSGGGSRWITNIQAGPRDGVEAARYGRRVAQFLSQAKIAKGTRIGIAGLTGGRYSAVRFPEGVASYTSVMELREAIAEMEFCDGTHVLDEARYIKGPEEVNSLRQAVSFAEESAMALAKVARPGVAAASVYARMMSAPLEAGAQYAYVVWRAGAWGETAPRYTATPKGIIAPGWFINNEIAAAALNYGCQICQPVSIGAVPNLAQDLFEVGKIAFQSACEVMRPGTTWGEIEDQVKATAEGSGYQVELLVHGRGLFRYSPMLADGDGPLIVPGGIRGELRNEVIRTSTTFVLKPFATLPGDRRELVGWGDTVVVEESGARRLGTRAQEIITVT